MLYHIHFLVMLHHSKNFREYNPVEILGHGHSLIETATEKCSLKIVAHSITHKMYYLI